MVKLTKIYTRHGDDGKTHLVGGERVAKHSTRVECYGTVDELNSHLGLCRTIAEGEGRKKFLPCFSRVQNELFDLGAELAARTDDLEKYNMAAVSQEMVATLEGEIDNFNDGLEELKSFVLPGGTLLNAQLHIARTICRRAERLVVKLSQEEDINEQVIHYLNRLSDLLFVMARRESTDSKASEFLWTPKTPEKA